LLPIVTLVYDPRDYPAPNETVDRAPGACRLSAGLAMKEFPHPFAWGAFGLTGVGR